MILNDFIEKSRAVHGSKYEYSKVEWTSPQSKVEIVCPTHGSFWQKACNHFYCKSGCPACGGRRIPSTRTREICRDSGIAFNCIYKQKFNDGSAAQAIETTLLQELSSVYQRHEATYTGSTECFVDVDTDRLLSILPH